MFLKIFGAILLFAGRLQSYHYSAKQLSGIFQLHFSWLARSGGFLLFFYLLTKCCYLTAIVMDNT